jgi:hypothetical protein
MADNHRPNPLTKAAESSHLPREVRARVNQTTDPIPEGKVPQSPTHHFDIQPACHDIERSNPKTGDELRMEHHELEKMQRQSQNHVDLKSNLQKGMDFRGSATTANKDMPSTHRRADFGG